MSSSDSSEDENLEFLKQAADTQFFKDSMFQSTGKNNNAEIKQTSSVISLRPIKNNDEQFNVLDVTPEFQKHIAKKLSDIIEKYLNEKTGKQKHTDKHKIKREGKEGIRLFKDSTVHKKQRTISERVECHKPTGNKTKQNEQNIDFKQIAVSPEDILSQKDLKHWSTWSRSKVFEYRRLKNGKLEYTAPKFV